MSGWSFLHKLFGVIVACRNQNGHVKSSEAFAAIASSTIRAIREGKS